MRLKSLKLLNVKMSEEKLLRHSAPKLFQDTIKTYQEERKILNIWENYAMKTKLNLEMAINIIASEWKKKFEKVIKEKKILCFSSTHKRNDDYCEGFYFYFPFIQHRKHIFICLIFCISSSVRVNLLPRSFIFFIAWKNISLKNTVFLRLIINNCVQNT